MPTTLIKPQTLNSLDFSDIDAAILAPRVAAGVAVLDEVRPGWEQLVDWDLLDMNDTERCILGQVFGHYADAPMFDDLLMDREWPLASLSRVRLLNMGQDAMQYAEDHGFDILSNNDVRELMIILGRVWRQVAAERGAV